MASISVIGAGIAGLSLAWEMARRGHHVRVIEAQGIGAGSSGGTVGALAPHAPESWNAKKQFQLDSLLAARDFWASVADAGGIDPHIEHIRSQTINGLGRKRPDTARFEHLGSLSNIGRIRL